MHLINCLLFSSFCATAVLAQEMNLRILDQTEVDLGDRAIFYNRVAPPLLKPTPAPAPSVAPRNLSAEEWNAMKSREKAEIQLFVSATVYDHQVTELRWSRAEGEYRVWSSIDFNYLRGLGGFETTETRYSFLLGVGNETRDRLNQWNVDVDARQLPARLRREIPALASIPERGPGKSKFKVISAPNNEVPEEVVNALENLHRYYDENRERLIRDYTASEAARIAQEKRNRENPPVPKDSTINFFPIKSVTAGQRQP